MTLPGHDLLDRVGPGELPPRVLLRRLQRQRDPLAVQVDVEDLDLDLLADLDDLGRVVDVLPGQLGDVHQAVDAAEVDERAEVDDRGHDTLADLALLQLVEELGAHLGLGLLQPRPAGQDHVVAVLVQLDDLGLELPADVRLQVADPAHLDQRRGQEAAQPDVEDEATLDHLDDGAADDAVLLLDLLDRAPGALVLRPLLGEDQAAFLVLLLEDQGLDVVADGDDLGGVDVVLDRQLARGDDALGLVADVEQDLVPIDLDDGAFDNVAVVEVLDGLVDRGEEGFLGADVVDGDLGWRSRWPRCCSSCGRLLRSDGCQCSLVRGDLCARGPPRAHRTIAVRIMNGFVRPRACSLPRHADPRVHRAAYRARYHSVQPSRAGRSARFSGRRITRDPARVVGRGRPRRARGRA